MVRGPNLPLNRSTQREVMDLLRKIVRPGFQEAISVSSSVASKRDLAARQGTRTAHNWGYARDEQRRMGVRDPCAAREAMRSWPPLPRNRADHVPSAKPGRCTRDRETATAHAQAEAGGEGHPPHPQRGADRAHLKHLTPLLPQLARGRNGWCCQYPVFSSLCCWRPLVSITCTM